MKKTKIMYWISTILFVGFMLFSSIPDVMVTEEAKAFLTHLGYPVYFIPFIGIAKVLGCIAIIIPGFPRVKEWAYAGMAFDLIGATYSVVASDGFMLPMLIMLVPIGLGTLSYFYFHKIVRSN